MLYGTHGIGKSTFASCAPKPVFIQTEDGLGEIDCDKFPLTTTFDQAMQALSELYTDEHSYRTVVVDSLDWLERLIWAEVCRKRNVESIEDIGYAKGYVFALTQWREFLEGLSALRNDKGMTIDPDRPRPDRALREPRDRSLRPLRAAPAPPGVAGHAGVVRRGPVRHVQGLHQADGRGLRPQADPGHRHRRARSSAPSSGPPTWPRTA